MELSSLSRNIFQYTQQYKVMRKKKWFIILLHVFFIILLIYLSNKLYQHAYLNGFRAGRDAVFEVLKPANTKKAEPPKTNDNPVI